MEPPERDPYRAVWQMSQVGDAGQHSGRRIRWVAGTVSGLIAFAPFALVTAIVWGFFADEVDVNAAGWAILLVGLAAGLTLGGYVATNDE
jgi:hypothetical protein